MAREDLEPALQEAMDGTLVEAASRARHLMASPGRHRRRDGALLAEATAIAFARGGDHALAVGLLEEAAAAYGRARRTNKVLTAAEIEAKATEMFGPRGLYTAEQWQARMDNARRALETAR